GLLPQVSKGTLVIIPVVEELEYNEWGVKIVEATDNVLSLLVNSSPQAVIGRFELTVKLQPAGERENRTEHKPANDIYILFNPWCEADAVFVEDEEWRKEYVLNETGRIYYGTKNQIGARTWNFGQFDKGVLDACLYLLEKGKMPHSGRGDPISMVRVVSAMVNSQDDRGVLVGNWSGDYTGGSAPTEWVGSVDILLQFHRTGEPVNYGQCWVFSGVTTTENKHLNCPFKNCHDSLQLPWLDQQLQLLFFSYLFNCCRNFHVWNDCWMARLDLPPGYGGWQAIDATPQETSAGTYCCGPASLQAIKSGLVYLKCDAPFIFAEVNSDRIYWQRQHNGTFQKVLVQKNAVGHQISTKAVGLDEREDITHLYKYPEDSEEERIAVETACQYGSKPTVYLNSAVMEDVALDIQTQEDIQMGSDVTVRVLVENCSSEHRSISLFLKAAVVYYTGVYKNSFKQDREEVLLSPAEGKELLVVLSYSQYQEYLVDQAAMMLTVSGRVVETGQVLAKQHNFRLRTPDLQIMPYGEAIVGGQMKAEIVFLNPLPKILKNVTFRIEGPGLQKPKKVQVGDVGRHATVTLKETFVPTKPGPRKLIASLHCRELTQVHGVAEVIVLSQ
uniref:Protein-glutamine gamma-glutamyltransferase K n=1 Tax=Latimeria chalumnae TaxID=7897 RepID=H3A119_LATCH